MADGHDSSRWQASGHRPWSGNDQAFRPDFSGSGAPPTGQGPQPQRCFSLTQLGQLGVELEAAVVTEVIYQLADLIDERSVLGQRLLPMSEQSVALCADGAVTWRAADLTSESVTVEQVLADLIAMARRLIEGQVVGASLARLLMSTPTDPVAIRDVLAASADEQLVASVVSAAVSRADGPSETASSSITAAAAGASTTQATTANASESAGAGAHLRSPRAHRASAQARVDRDATGSDSHLSRVTEALRGRATPRRAVLVSAAVAVAVVGLAVLAQGAPNEVEAAASTLTAPATPTSAASATPTDTHTALDETAAHSPDLASVDWNMIVAGLDSTRSRAFQTGDRDLLDSVNAPDSPAAKTDGGALSKLTTSGLRARGLATEVSRVKVHELRADQATLVVTDRRPAYRLVSATTGATVSKVAARDELVWRVRLSPSEPTASTEAGGWRIYSVDAL